MSPPLLTSWPASLTPQGFLTNFISDMASSDLLSRQERGFLIRQAEAALKSNRDSSHETVVRDYAFLMACDLVRQIPGPVDVRVYGEDRICEAFGKDEMTGGHPFTAEAIPSEDTVIEVRCRSKAFDEASNILPQSRNLEIALWQIEQGFRSGQKLVAFGGLDGEGVMHPTADRRMAFRLAAPTLLNRELRKDGGEGSLDAVSMNRLATFREYEFLLGNRRWPAACPATRQNVDDEGLQHPIYVLSHDFSHLGLRSRRSRSLQDLSHLVLRAGLEVFPDVDDADAVAAMKGLSTMRRFFGGLVELNRIYFEDQLAERLSALRREQKFNFVSGETRGRYVQFLSNARTAVASYAKGQVAEQARPIMAALDRQLGGA